MTRAIKYPLPPQAGQRAECAKFARNPQAMADAKRACYDWRLLSARFMGELIDRSHRRRGHWRGSGRACGRRLSPQGRLEFHHSREKPSGRLVLASALRTAAFAYDQAALRP